MPYPGVREQWKRDQREGCGCDLQGWLRLTGCLCEALDEGSVGVGLVLELLE